jgi:hypothetical protein
VPAHAASNMAQRLVRHRLGMRTERHYILCDGRCTCGLARLLHRALLLLVSRAAFDAPELIALNAAEVKFVPEGLEAFVASSKTDQERKGHTKMVAYGSDPPTCLVRAVKDWLELAAGCRRPRVWSRQSPRVALQQTPHGSRGRRDRQTNSHLFVSIYVRQLVLGLKDPLILAQNTSR